MCVCVGGGVSRRRGLHNPFWTLGCRPYDRPVRRGHLAEKIPLQGAGRRPAQVSRCWLWLGLAQTGWICPPCPGLQEQHEWSPGFKQLTPVHKWNKPSIPSRVHRVLGGHGDLRLQGPHGKVPAENIAGLQGPLAHQLWRRVPVSLLCHLGSWTGGVMGLCGLLAQCCCLLLPSAAVGALLSLREAWRW